MKHIEKKFAFKYAPTKQWVYIWDGMGTYYVHLMDEFHPDCCFSAKNVGWDTIGQSYWNRNETGMNGMVDVESFEMVEIEVTHKTKKKPK